MTRRGRATCALLRAAVCAREPPAGSVPRRAVLIGSDRIGSRWNGTGRDGTELVSQRVVTQRKVESQTKTREAVAVASGAGKKARRRPLISITTARTDAHDWPVLCCAPLRVTSRALLTSTTSVCRVTNERNALAIAHMRMAASWPHRTYWRRAGLSGRAECEQMPGGYI